MSETIDLSSLGVFDGLGFSLLGLAILVFFALLFSSYVKIVTTLGILRIGLGFRSLPSAFVTGGLALVLAFFVMYPTVRASLGAMDQSLRVSSGASQSSARIRALDAALSTWSKFLMRHAHEKEVEKFINTAAELDSKESGILASDEQKLKMKSSFRVLAPAFVVSELKEAFATGLTLFLPFLVIDLLVASILIAVGLQQLNPAIVSLPFKLLLFVMLDGWSLITTNLVATYGA